MNSRHFLVGATLLVGGIASAAPAAMAATAACTRIDNRAFIDYKVGLVDQTQIGSKDGSGNDNTSFYVAAKVMFTVSTTDSSNVTVYPGSNGTPLGFKVSNQGNTKQRFALSAITGSGNTSPFTGTDNYDLTPASIAVSLATVDVDAGVDSPALTITGNTPADATDGKIAVYALQAKAQWIGSGADVGALDGTVTAGTIGGSCAAPAATNIDFVVADGQGDGGDGLRDGLYAAKSAYQVTAASLTITKSSAVVYDPINCSAYGATPTCSGTARAVPGAVVEYTIQIHNAASGTATNVTVNDSVDSNLTFHVNGYAAAQGIQVTPPGGSATLLTNAADLDQGSYDAGTKVVTVNGLTVANGQDAYVKFRATIN